jgi:hypothetical protein
MDKWRVGDDTKSKETDGCPLTGPGDFGVASQFLEVSYLQVQMF